MCYFCLVLTKYSYYDCKSFVFLLSFQSTAWCFFKRTIWTMMNKMTSYWVVFFVFCTFHLSVFIYSKKFGFPFILFFSDRKVERHAPPPPLSFGKRTFHSKESERKQPGGKWDGSNFYTRQKTLHAHFLSRGLKYVSIPLLPRRRKEERKEERKKK